MRISIRDFDPNFPDVCPMTAEILRWRRQIAKLTCGELASDPVAAGGCPFGPQGFAEKRMGTHKNAPMTPTKSRAYGALYAHRSWRKVKVTKRPDAKDFATCMRYLVDIQYHFIILEPSALTCCSTISQPIRPGRLPVLSGGRSAAGTAPIGVPQRPKHASRTWSRSRSAFSPANASIGALIVSPASLCRDRRLRDSTQCPSRPRKMDVHDRRGWSQNGVSISEKSGQFQRVENSVFWP